MPGLRNGRLDAEGLPNRMRLSYLPNVVHRKLIEND